MSNTQYYRGYEPGSSLHFRPYFCRRTLLILAFVNKYSTALVFTTTIEAGAGTETHPPQPPQPFSWMDKIEPQPPNLSFLHPYTTYNRTTYTIDYKLHISEEGIAEDENE